ncbi:MAG: anti-sigma factor [Bryobacteraceae bacterium]
MRPLLNCADVEELLADYVDQTLLDRDVADLKAHFATCPECAALAADAMAAVNFMERAAVVEPPPQLVNKILFEIGNNKSGHEIVKPPFSQRFFGKGIRSILQPRFAMGMAMTMLSFGMLLRTEGIREWADLSPVNLAAAAEDRVVRLWDRGVKHYQSLKLVFEIQSRYQEWTAQQEKEKAEQEQNKAGGKQAK